MSSTAERGIWKPEQTPIAQEVVAGMGGVVEKNLIYLLPPEKLWQPSDLLPSPNAHDNEQFIQEVSILQEEARGTHPLVFVTLVGNTATEEALPSYLTMINRVEGIKDNTGADESAWARWARGWTAEEERHGKALAVYLYLSGSVDMRKVDLTTQGLIRNGFDPNIANHPYNAFVYTSFQELATYISHKNTGKLAQASGNTTLEKICYRISSDERRHAEFYTRIMKHVFEADPEGAVISLHHMFSSGIVMPGALMDIGNENAGKKQTQMFEIYSALAQDLGVYNVEDYIEIEEFLIENWGALSVSLNTSDARQAQEYLGLLIERQKRILPRLVERRNQVPAAEHPWIGEIKEDVPLPRIENRTTLRNSRQEEAA